MDTPENLKCGDKPLIVLPNKSGKARPVAGVMFPKGLV